MLIAGAMAGIGTAAAGIGSTVSAANSTNGADSLVDKMATKFNLNKDEVQAVFDENRSEKESERSQKINDSLAQAVKDGKLTQEQADALTSKIKELKESFDSKRQEFQDLSEEDRKSAMESKRTELEKWLADNNIPEEYARLIHMGKGGGPGRGQGNGNADIN